MTIIEIKEQQRTLRSIDEWSWLLAGAVPSLPYEQQHEGVQIKQPRVKQIIMPGVLRKEFDTTRDGKGDDWAEAWDLARWCERENVQELGWRGLQRLYDLAAHTVEAEAEARAKTEK